MRAFGALLIAVGFFGFIYVSDQRNKLGPTPDELGWREALELPQGRWDAARYACMLGGGLGILLALFPKGR
jgi:hypothetical protein